MGSVSQFQPLVPDARALAPLLEQAAAVVAEGHRLESTAAGLLQAVAHIDAEIALGVAMRDDQPALYAPESVRAIHAELYERLPLATA
jgi:hypothetical protein